MSECDLWQCTDDLFCHGRMAHSMSTIEKYKSTVVRYCALITE